MRNSTKIIRTIGTMLLVFVFLFSNLQISFAAPHNGGKKAAQNSTGVKPLTEEDKEWMKDNMIKLKKVRPNKLGLQRANEVRRKKGLNALDTSMAANIGDEVVSVSAASGSTGLNNPSYASANTSGIELTQSDLKSYVDNTELPFFPPLRDQGGLGTCASFSVTYYQATHMMAMARGWNVKDDPDDSKKLSPKWTYNFINNGVNQGSNQVDAYKLFMEQGIATWKDFPYDDNYTDWPVNPQVWKNAQNFKPDKIGYLQIYNGIDTPVKYENDANLNDIKQLLCNGYILSFSMTPTAWCYKTVSDNTAVSTDDSIVGANACYKVSNVNSSGHAMVIAGYNNDVWVDINSNGLIDKGEKGAFERVDPSDGTIGWICYDALNRISAVSGASNTNRNFAFWGSNTIYWMTAKASNTPILQAEIAVSHSARNQLDFELGYSEVSESNPSITWIPDTINTCGGNIPFDGSIVLDYTSLISGKNLSQTAKKWYVKVTDTNPDGNKATIEGFKLIDPSTGTESIYPMANDLTLDDASGNNSVTLSIQYQLPSQSASESQWTFKNDINSAFNIDYSGSDIVNSGGKIYLSGRNSADTSKNLLLQYNAPTDQWNVYDNNFPAYNYNSIVEQNNKMYFFPSGNEFISIYDITNKRDDNSVLVTLPGQAPNQGYTPVKSSDGKIYVVGGQSSGYIFAFNPANNSWTSIPGLRYTRYSPTVAALNGKLYIFGGTETNGKLVNVVEEYDTVSNTWSIACSLPYLLTKSGSDFKVVALNGKIYLFENTPYTIRVYEFNPDNRSWLEKDPVPYIANNTGTLNSFGVEAANGRIYLIKEASRNVLEFNPQATATANKAVKVELSAGTDNSQTNEIRRVLKVTNTGNTVISLSDVKLRYYYSIDGEKPQSFNCCNASIDSSLVNGTFVKMDNTSSNSDYYLEVGFNSHAGRFLPDKSVEVCIGLSKSDGSYYTQTNDYSFSTSPTSSSYIEWDKVTAYLNNELIWGNPPVAQSQNVALNKTVTADSANSTYPGSCAVDGDISSNASRWMPSGTSGSHYIAVDLGGYYNINQVRFYTGENGYNQPVSNYNIQWFDGTSWIDIVKRTGNTSSQVVENFNTVTASKIRLYNNPGEAIKLYELEIWGTKASKAAAPVINPEGGTYTSSQLVNISSPSGRGIIRYTTDGSTPASNSPIYNEPIPVSWDMTIKAVASVPGMSDSDTASASFIIRSKVEPPVIDPPTGLCTSGQKATISCATSGAAIRYTTDGTTPTAASSLYTGPINISGNMTIKAIALKSGTLDSDILSATYILYPWIQKKDLTIDGVSSSGLSVNSEGSLYLSCWDNSTINKGSLLKYDPLNDQWNLYDNTFPAVDNGARAIAQNGKIYIFQTGTFGTTSGNLTKVFVYDIASKQWDYTKKNLSQEIRSSAIAEYNGKIYLIGGYNSGVTGTVLEYDTLNDTWTPKTAMNFPRQNAKAAVLNGEIYVFGGTDSNGVLVNFVEKYNPVSGSWSTVSGLHSGIILSGMTCYPVSLNNKIYLFASGNDHSSVFEYNPSSTNRWTEKISLPVKENLGFTVCKANGKVYIIRTGDNIVYEFDPAVTKAPKAEAPVSSIAAGTYTTAQSVVLSSETSGATIRYTTDGSTPTSDSPIYNSPLTVAGNMIIKATAIKEGYMDSDVSISVYKITPQLAAPVISLPEGTYPSTQTVTISCAGGSTLRYTTDGSTPTSDSPLYSGPITVPASMTIKAFVTKAGMMDSDVQSASYIIATLPKAEAPVFDIPEGTYTAIQTVAISSPESGATIRYTTDGSTPTSDSPVYSSPITVAGTKTIKAIASKDGMLDSDVVSSTYTLSFKVGDTNGDGEVGTQDSVNLNNYIQAGSGYILVDDILWVGDLDGDGLINSADSGLMNDYLTGNITCFPKEKVKSPVFNPAGGTYTTGQTVTITSATSGAAIRYTTDGSTPTSASSLYNSPITVSSTMTINAIAIKDGMVASEVSSAAYTIIPKVAVPSFSLAEGTYAGTQTVSVTCAVPGAAIRYTTDGSTPTSTSPLYSGPITVSSTQTIKAYACCSGMTDSDVAAAAYTIVQSSIRVDFYNNEKTAAINTIYPLFIITNTGTSSIDLSDIKLRYYYTIDGEKEQYFWCDSCYPGNKSNVTGNFVKMGVLKATADYYLEIGFTSQAGTLSPNTSVEVKVRLNKGDWTNYNQSNDYSFNPTASTYTTNWTKVTGYRSGSLIFGIEP